MMRRIRPWPLVGGLLCPPHTHTPSHTLNTQAHCSLAAWGETCCNLGGREQRASLMQRLAGPFDVEPSHSLLTPDTHTHTLHHRVPQTRTFAKKKNMLEKCNLLEPKQRACYLKLHTLDLNWQTLHVLTNLQTFFSIVHFHQRWYHFPPFYQACRTEMEQPDERDAGSQHQESIYTRNQTSWGWLLCAYKHAHLSTYHASVVHTQWCWAPAWVLGECFQTVLKLKLHQKSDEIW